MGWKGRVRRRFMAGGEGCDLGAVYVPWIFAEADDGWREKQKRNPKRMGELSQTAFLLKAQSLGSGLAVPWGDKGEV